MRFAALDISRQDLLYAFRIIRKNPSYALTAVFTLALGIAANTAMFTVVNAVLLKPLGYFQPDRLVRISGNATTGKFDVLQHAQSFTEVGAFFVATENVAISEVDGPEALNGARVTSNFLSILGSVPLRGRSFLPGEESPGPSVAMISSELWQRHFSGDPQIVGRVVRLEGAPCTIIGVLPPGFQFPFPDLDVWRLWQPDLLPPQSRLNSPILSVFGRLKPGVTLDQASAEMAVVHRRYTLSSPGKLDAKPNQITSVTPIKDQLVRNIRAILWMLFGAVGFVLVIACTNVASLVLARATSRSREFAVRAALGASRRRLLRQLFTENLLLSLAGGALGVLLGQWGLHGIAHLPSLNLPRRGEIHLDSAVLAFTLGLSVLTGLLFGLAPSLSASRPDLAGVMKTGEESVVAGWSKRLALWLRPRGLLVVVQVALSIILLIGATLMVRSLAQLRRVDPGFQAHNLLTMKIALSQTRYATTAKSSAFLNALVERIQTIPGVRGAAVTFTLPMTGFAATPVHIIGQPLVELNERPMAVLQTITPGYFRTMGIPVRRGRDFSRQDSIDSPFVAIINEGFARRFWPAYPQGEDPVGHFLLAGSNPEPLQVVGIVANVRQAGLAEDAERGLYRPRTQTPPFPAMLAVSTEGDPMRFANSIREQVTALDRDQAITDVKTMEDVVEDSEGQRRSIMILLGLFAAVGLLLAVVGIYGLLAYTVAQRTREMAIRRALGAQPNDIVRLILQQGLSLTLVGVVVGLAGALALTRVLSSLLFGVSATDPLTFAGITVLLIFVTLGASYIPAWRALRLEPSSALKGPFS